MLSVLLFHLDVALFSGGFVGVDAFFVISGFLITRLIRDDVAAGKFSFTRFYVRRARRIFPALFLTLAATFVAGYLLFSSQHLMRLGGALVSAVFSVSNFYFWGEAGYFDTAAHLKPLLHTWSLGIEEQFYLLWPAILVFTLLRAPRWAPVALLFVGGALSLFLSEFFVRWPSIAFYLLPFRAFEFALGAVLVWLNPHRMKSAIWGELWVAAGLGMLGYSIVSFSGETPFPGLNALIPCVGTALIIYGGESRFLSRLLSNPIAVGIGLISYSLYLVHWPVPGRHVAAYRALIRRIAPGQLLKVRTKAVDTSLEFLQNWALGTTWLQRLWVAVEDMLYHRSPGVRRYAWKVMFVMLDTQFDQLGLLRLAFFRIVDD